MNTPRGRDRAPAVVYVHGLWMPGFEGALLQRRLRAQLGCRSYLFQYQSVRAPLARITAALGQMLSQIDAPEVHLVGHSLGGLVILNYLERYQPPQPGRVVFLATPSSGSSAARRFARFWFGRPLLGPAGSQELLRTGARNWASPRELGIIAGTLPAGFGRLLLTFREANDGTVAVSETELAGAKSRLCLPVTHSGMLLSAQVARAAGSFLQHGRFGA